MRLFFVPQLILCFSLITPAIASTKMVFTTYPGSGMTLVEKPIVEDLYSRLGMAVEVVSLPAERSLLMSNSGKFDGELGRLEIIGKNYKNLIMIPVPLEYIKNTALVSKTNVDLSGYESLKPYTVVALNGYKYFEDMLIKHKIEHVLVTHFEQIFQLLEKGRVDIALTTELDALKFMSIRHSSSIRLLPNVFDKLPTYHFIHRKHAHLVEKLTTELKRMHQEKIPETIREDVKNSLLKAQINN